MIEDFSFETVTRRAAEVADVRDLLPGWTRIAIPHLDGDDIVTLVDAAHAVRAMGFVPVPHVAARRLKSAAGLAAKAAAVREQGLDASVTTQFATPASIREWLASSRRRGIDLPVRVGVPGAHGVFPALAARLGLVGGVAGYLDHPPELKLHFSPLGALRPTALLASRYASAAARHASAAA